MIIYHNNYQKYATNCSFCVAEFNDKRCTSPLASPSSDSEEESMMSEAGRERPWWGDGEGVLLSSPSWSSFSSSLSAPGTRNDAKIIIKRKRKQCRDKKTFLTKQTN